MDRHEFSQKKENKLGCLNGTKIVLRKSSKLKFVLLKIFKIDNMTDLFYKTKTYEYSYSREFDMTKICFRIYKNFILKSGEKFCMKY